MSRPCSSLPKKRGAKGKSWSSRNNRRSWTNAALLFAGLCTVFPTRTIPGVNRPPDRGISASVSLCDSVSIARVLTLLVACCSPLQECFPQKSGYCEKDRRAKILLSPRTSPGSETEERQLANTADTTLRYW